MTTPRSSALAAAIGLVAAGLTALLPTSAANAHSVVCYNDAQEPYYTTQPYKNYKNMRGATIIDCAPTAPDAQRTLVQLQRLPYRDWVNMGEPVISYHNSDFFRVVDTTSCTRGTDDLWRVYSDHLGRHGNVREKQDTGPVDFIYCQDG